MSNSRYPKKRFATSVRAGRYVTQPSAYRDDEPECQHRRSIRLKGYDYSQGGAYFVTIVAQNRTCLFGKIVDDLMQLNDAGRIACDRWMTIPDHFPQVGLDAFVIMPNHVHGILVIVDAVGANVVGAVGAKDFSPLQTSPTSQAPRASRRSQRPQKRPGTSQTIGSVIRGFKIGVTKWMRRHKPFHNIWQRNYYEHIIRDDADLNRIQQYIVENPSRWADDTENSARRPAGSNDSGRTR